MGDIEELVDLVLTAQHPRLRERCIVDRIVSVLEGPPNFLRLRCLKEIAALRAARLDFLSGTRNQGPDRLRIS
jgi:hypothetical protein